MTQKDENSEKKSQAPPPPPPKKSPYPSPNTRFVKIEDMDKKKGEE